MFHLALYFVCARQRLSDVARIGEPDPRRGVLVDGLTSESALEAQLRLRSEHIVGAAQHQHEVVVVVDGLGGQRLHAGRLARLHVAHRLDFACALVQILAHGQDAGGVGTRAGDVVRAHVSHLQTSELLHGSGQQQRLEALRLLLVVCCVQNLAVGVGQRNARSGLLLLHRHRVRIVRIAGLQHAVDAVLAACELRVQLSAHAQIVELSLVTRTALVHLVKQNVQLRLGAARVFLRR